MGVSKDNSKFVSISLSNPRRQVLSKGRSFCAEYKMLMLEKKGKASRGCTALVVCPACQTHAQEEFLAPFGTSGHSPTTHNHGRRIRLCAGTARAHPGHPRWPGQIQPRDDGHIPGLCHGPVRKPDVRLLRQSGPVEAVRCPPLRPTPIIVA